MANLSELSDESLWCRTEGHQFRWLNDETTVSPRGRLIEWVRRMQCAECGATAKRVIDARDFRPSPRKIDSYPDDYLLKGQGRVARAEVFREAFSRRLAA